MYSNDASLQVKLLQVTSVLNNKYGGDSIISKKKLERSEPHVFFVVFINKHKIVGADIYAAESINVAVSHANNGLIYSPNMPENCVTKVMAEIYPCDKSGENISWKQWESGTIDEYSVRLLNKPENRTLIINMIVGKYGPYTRVSRMLGETLLKYNIKQLKCPTKDDATVFERIFNIDVKYRVELG